MAYNLTPYIPRHSSNGAESRTWARGQLKYNEFPVLWTSKQTGKMPKFCPNFDVISKKKGLQVKMPLFSQDFEVVSKIKGLQVKMPPFSRILRWSQKKKVFGFPHADLSVSFRWALCWAPWSQQAPWWVPLKPMGPLKSMGPGSLSPPALPSLRPCTVAKTLASLRLFPGDSVQEAYITR